MKKKNWKAHLLSLRALAMAEIGERNKLTEPGRDVAGEVLVLLGRVKLADEMLAEYGVEVEDDKPCIARGTSVAAALVA